MSQQAKKYQTYNKDGEVAGEIVAYGDAIFDGPLIQTVPGVLRRATVYTSPGVSDVPRGGIHVLLRVVV